MKKNFVTSRSARRLVSETNNSAHVMSVEGKERRKFEKLTFRAKPYRAKQGIKDSVAYISIILN